MLSGVKDFLHPELPRAMCVDPEQVQIRKDFTHVWM